VSDSENGPFG